MNSGLLHARRILTLTPGQNGDAIWWEKGRIRRVGSLVDLDREAPRNVPRYDFPDGLVTPGLVDGHTHFGMWSLNRRRVQLADTRSREDALRRIALAKPVQGWVLGQGWNANRWELPPDRWSLDAIQPGPVYLDSLDVHAAWVNSAALALAQIDRATPDPFGGRIVRDAAGEPTGLLLERAVDLVARRLPLPPAQDLDDAILEAQAEAHRLGLTGIQDVESDLVLESFRRLERAGRLGLRVLFHPPVASLPGLLHHGVRSGDG
jgi:predicted amidohydrolase YtcJ